VKFPFMKRRSAMSTTEPEPVPDPLEDEEDVEPAPEPEEEANESLADDGTPGAAPPEEE
jgi:hypothetical protein